MPGFTLRTIRCPMATSLTVFGRSFHRPSPVDSMCSQSPMPGFTLQHIVVRSVLWSPPPETQEPDDGIHSYGSGAAPHANKNVAHRPSSTPFPHSGRNGVRPPPFYPRNAPEQKHSLSAFCGSNFSVLTPSRIPKYGASFFTSAPSLTDRALHIDPLARQTLHHISAPRLTARALHIGPLAWHPGCLDQEKV